MPVTLRLVDAWHRPVAGVEVWLEIPQFAPRRQCSNGDGEVEFDVAAGGHYRVSIRSDLFFAESRRQVRGALTTVFCMVRPECCAPEEMRFPTFGDLCDSLKEVLERSRTFGAELRTAHRVASVHGAPEPVATLLPENVVRAGPRLEDRQLLAANIASDVDAARLYGQLEPAQRATLLNLFVKMYAVTISSYSVWKYVKEVTAIEEDRLYAHVYRQLLSATEWAIARSPCWSRVCGWLHDPPKGYERKLSAKTKEKKGNLQLTLFQHRRREHIQVDADVDLEGLWHTHLGEVLRNRRTGNKTHPGIVYQLLRWYQNIEPHREFEVAHFVGSRGPWRAIPPVQGVCRRGVLQYM